MPENREFYELKRNASRDSECSGSSEKVGGTDFIALNKRSEGDPMRLHGEIVREIRREFEKRGASCLPSQFNAISVTAEALLTAQPGIVTVSAQTPGAGKSTLIRGLLVTIAPKLADPNDPIGQAIGGITVVVETSIEGHELMELANESAGCTIAALIESANDSALRRYGCPSGLATSYAECLKRGCPDYEGCPYMLPSHKARNTPILIMLHASYQRHISDMSGFMTWADSDGTEHLRRWLLIDELPSRFESNNLTLSSLNGAESEIDEGLASYNYHQNQIKRELLYVWGTSVHHPMRKLLSDIQRRKDKTGLVSKEEMEAAGISMEQLTALNNLLVEHKVGFGAQNLTDALLSGGSAYYNIGQTASLSFPRLIPFDDSSDFATFIFSGTAALAPEITSDPAIHLLPDALEESYARLTVYVQRGDGFSASKTALRSTGNLTAASAWVKDIIARERDTHKRFLVVTYKEDAEVLWNMLPEYRDILIPYVDRAGEAYERLPYFGGMNGSNRYLEATCVICVGLNRFDPSDYLNRALALDTSGEIASKIAAAKESGDTHLLTQMPPVMDLQDITLAQDIVQLVFRSALRMHGETQPISLWLFQPPNGTVEHIRRYFGDCNIVEVTNLPIECATARTRAAHYMGEPTHAAKLLRWLASEWTSSTVTPEEIRVATGLTKVQFKEAKKNPDVKKFFAQNVIHHGSGKNTVYERKNNQNAA